MAFCVLPTERGAAYVSAQVVNTRVVEWTVVVALTSHRLWRHRVVDGGRSLCERFLRLGPYDGGNWGWQGSTDGLYWNDYLDGSLSVCQRTECGRRFLSGQSNTTQERVSVCSRWTRALWAVMIYLTVGIISAVALLTHICTQPVNAGGTEGAVVVTLTSQGQGRGCWEEGRRRLRSEGTFPFSGGVLGNRTTGGGWL